MRTILFDGDLIDVPNSMFPEPMPTPETYVVPIPLLRQRVQRLGMWEAFAGYVAQHPTLWLELLSTEAGVDPHHPAFGPAFDELMIPEGVRGYLLASPSEGVGDPPEIAVEEDRPDE